jgi:tRNA pseudouridine55 synthase
MSSAAAPCGERVDGILVVDKPQGPTSSDVVVRLRRRFKLGKVGHAGTLDPMATGVLVVCVGKATALAELLTGQDKRYLATLKLGARTDSGDAEGAVVEERPVPPLERAAVEAVLASLVGPQDQVPPMVSAVKVDGKRLYALAREGKSVERAPRPITIHALALTGFSESEIIFDAHCSKGTYVRVLGEDIAARLGTVGHLTALRRTASGAFGIGEAAVLETVLTGELSGFLCPMERAVEALPRVVVSGRDASGLVYGQAPRLRTPGPEGQVALMDEQGKLLALAVRAQNGVLKLARVLVTVP